MTSGVIISHTSPSNEKEGALKSAKFFLPSSSKNVADAFGRKELHKGGKRHRENGPGRKKNKASLWEKFLAPAT